MSTLPALFVSHGAPTLAIVDSPAHRFLRELGKTLPRPKAILVASARWETRGGPAVSLATKPETIHDFGGFPDALFAIQYPAPGAPMTGVRGASPADHERMGRALALLRDEGVLVIGSGSLTHNLHEFRGQPIDVAAPAWVSEFGNWMKARLDDNDLEALRSYAPVRLTPSATTRPTSTCCRCTWQWAPPVRTPAPSGSMPATSTASWQWTCTGFRDPLGRGGKRRIGRGAVLINKAS